MNASTWKKAADIVAKTTSVSPQASAAATTEVHNLRSLQLSTLSTTTGNLQVLAAHSHEYTMDYR